MGAGGQQQPRSGVKGVCEKIKRQLREADLKEEKATCIGRPEGERRAQAEECEEEKETIFPGERLCLRTPSPEDDQKNDPTEEQIKQTEDKPVLCSPGEQLEFLK